MPSFVVHGLLPPLLLLALGLAPRRAVLWMLPFTFLPDLDFWIGIHRATLGNVFILLPSLLLWYIWREDQPTRATYAGVATFYLASHLVMDIFAGGVVLFYPLWDRYFFWFVAIVVNTRTGEINPVSDPGTSAGAPQVTEFFTWLSPVEAAMLALTIVTIAGALAWRHWGKQATEVWLEEVE